jgi:hypothetical protein
MGCGSLDRGLLQDLFDGDGYGHGGGHAGAGGGSGGGPVGQDCGGLIGGDELYATIASDLARLDAEDAPFTRYLSLANQANADGCGPVLDGARAALDKLVNSVSLNTRLTEPIPIDVNETLYRIDLRDYGWDRAIAVDGASFADAWEAIIASSLGRAAGDLLIDSEQLGLNLRLLDPALAVLGGGGLVDRDDFSVFYRQSLCILSVVNENLPDPSVCQ